MFASAAEASGVTRVEVLGREDVGQYGGNAFRRYHGLVHGTVAADEDVAGLPVALAGRTALTYAVPFEVIAPVDQALTDAVIVEVENRGRPTALGLLTGFAAGAAVAPSDVRYPAGLGNGFPFRAGVAYARVAWQAGVAADVPAAAQGVGLVILRDFGRMLAGEGANRGPLPTFRRRVLMGISQSAWMANALVQEGFNRDPATDKAVYQGLFTRNGTGNVLAVNHAAAGGPQAPYPLPDAVPLTPAQLLTRPGSDPMVVDVAAYTDFYRLRASVFAAAPGVPRLRRYAVAAAHAPAGGYPDALIFGTLRCNGGVPAPLNPLNDAAYVRALLTALLGAIGTREIAAGKLPAEHAFDLVTPGIAPINLLSGQNILVPRVDGDAMPVGGVPMAEAALPLGRPVPPAISPVGTRSITDVCGNFGGWAPFSSAELRERYGLLDDYRKRVASLLQAQVRRGWLLADDVEAEAARIGMAADRAFGSYAREAGP
ncbi:alpha/beta hydrolase domain-containing protein [Sphingomonas sp. TZW2008]|uniref:alpha/beta hydrolase domain-containing protein n=1 Tax=Sphingomonas sp. TZW2008 TaxID=1917973 RepID=UPI000A271615|nr:alpha/beta hydrolase domain-containing protein [Sphingomonas sp. TZW2008]